MKKVFPYVIEGFSPLPITEGIMNRFNFHLYLDANIAKTFLETPLTPHAFKVFQEKGSKTLSSLKYRTLEPYLFDKDSLLVRQINLGVDGKCINTNQNSVDFLSNIHAHNNYLEYHTSNLDSSPEAYACLSLFTDWVDYAQIYVDMVREEIVNKSSSKDI